MKSDERPEWLKDVSTGVAEGRSWEVFLDGKTHAIVKQPGGSSYIDRATGVKYFPVEYVLARKKDRDYWTADIKSIWKGRLTKVGRRVIESALEEADKT